jgi:hypothetical protein
MSSSHNEQPESAVKKQDNHEEDKEDELLFPQKYIRPDEEGKIIFTQRGILDLVKKIKEETTNGEWITICDKDGLKMEYKNGVDFT